MAYAGQGSSQLVYKDPGGKDPGWALESQMVNILGFVGCGVCQLPTASVAARAARDST